VPWVVVYPAFLTKIVAKGRNVTEMWDYNLKTPTDISKYFEDAR
jgi:hypothetical protein